MKDAPSQPLGSPAVTGPEGHARPLCVDLRALLASDPLWEQVILLLRRRPWLIVALPLWTLLGRARLERSVAKRLPLDVAHLPYRRELLDLLRTSAAQGRRLVLLNDGDPALAEAVVRHLDLDAEILDVRTGQMPQVLHQRLGATAYDRVLGPESAVDASDQSAQQLYLVGADAGTLARIRPLGDKVEVLSKRPSRSRALIKALRPHQWAKNALVVVPLLLAPGLPTVHMLAIGLLAMAAFSLCASAGYVFNDLMDLGADRAHPSKHRRPFASGALPIFYGPPLLFGLLALSFGLSLALLPLGFTGMLAAYLVATLSYSFSIKSKLMADVVVLAWLYTHRVLAGGIATSIPISAWLLAFSMFMFCSLAFAKRYIELRQSLKKAGQLKSRGYHTQDLEMVASMGPTAGYIAILVFCLYVESSAVKVNYQNPMVLWFVCPVLLYWISRVWFLAHRGNMQDDPVKFALTDRLSWACAVAIAVIAALARFWPH
jgi:4-hydroxybenzoate polyprenyltransferase